MSKEFINIVGAHQNNLKQVDLKLPLNEFIVITGVSGSGKSSLAFDTIYSEGQRRYVETFSPYARQFLDRMDKPRVERIEGIPPAIAIDQTNQVRTSRSTVGTMTEINDHLKLLFARMASLYCSRCAAPVQRDTPESILEHLLSQSQGKRAIVTGGGTGLGAAVATHSQDRFPITGVLDPSSATGWAGLGKTGDRSALLSTQVI